MFRVRVDVFAEQARHVEGGSTGLIPSQMLEEKRKAFVKRDVELPPAGQWQIESDVFPKFRQSTLCDLQAFRIYLLSRVVVIFFSLMTCKKRIHLFHRADTKCCFHLK